jgi:VWFA-related protein
MRRFAAVLAASFVSVAAFAQVRETIHVNIVEVPVTVADRAGNPVRGLTEKNFELFDNGKKRTITSFDVVDFAAAESVNAISPMNPVARRSFLLLFDLGFSSPNSLRRAQEAARKFVNDALQPRDIVAVATIDADRGCKLLTSFTTDRELIASAIDNPISFRGLDPLGISNQTAAFIPELEQPGMANEIAPILSGRAAEAQKQQLEMAHSMAYMNESAIRQRVDRNLDSLAGLAKILNSLPGHKQVVLLSEGLPAKYLVGRDARDSKAEMEQAERIIRGTWASLDAQAGDADQDKRFGSASSQTLLERMSRYFRRSDVVLHAIDIQGVRVQDDTYEGARINSNAGLAALARPTGGTVLENVNSVGENFRRLMHQQEVVYILGFRAPDENTGSFHELKVKVNGIGFGGRVEHRAGYFESGALPADRKLTDAEVIVNDIPQNGIRVASFAASFPTSSERAQVPVILEIDGSDLMEGTFLNGATHIAIYAFDEHGVVRDRIYQTLTFDRGKIGDRLRSAGMKYYGTLSLPPGNYAIKTLLRISSSERRGYARTDIRVPRRGEFGLVPFVVDDHASDWLMVKGTSHADASYPFQINGQALVPAVLPHVHAGEARKIALFISNANPDELQLDMLPQGTIIASAKSAEVTKIVIEVPAIGPGVNALDVIVRRGGGDALRARMPVVVQ